MEIGPFAQSISIQTAQDCIMSLNIADWFNNPPVPGDPYWCMFLITQADGRTAFGRLGMDWAPLITRVKGDGFLAFSDRSGPGGQSMFAMAPGMMDQIDFEIAPPGPNGYRLGIRNRNGGGSAVLDLQPPNADRLMLGWGPPIGQSSTRALYAFSILGRILN